MKVAVLKHGLVGKQLVFSAEKKAVDKSLEELKNESQFTQKFRNLSFERFAIRKSMEVDKVSLSKEFKR